jgi:hypothetical protein
MAVPVVRLAVIRVRPVTPMAVIARIGERRRRADAQRGESKKEGAATHERSRTGSALNDA